MKLSAITALSLVYITTVASTSINPHHHRLASRATCTKGRTAANKQCCVWYKVLDDLQSNLFDGGKCGDDAHDSLRLSFHDAIGYSPILNEQGLFGGDGADGSLIKFSVTELTYLSNDGLDAIVEAEKWLADKYNVTYGDIIQFAAAVGVRNCVGGPRISFMAGRPQATQAAPDGLVPDAGDAVDVILARVKDAGLTPAEMVDLLASHSIGVQEDIDPAVPGMPFDTTPTILDTAFYNQVLYPGTVWPGNGSNPGEAKSASKHTFRLQSDYALARDKRTTEHWKKLAESQSLMVKRFAAAMAKMALIGQDPALLTDCSEVIPLPKRLL
ncbi:heme peroxidase [Mycena polygramma]|nr:heme peroxidase [Mycena polygramma]